MWIGPGGGRALVGWDAPGAVGPAGAVDTEQCGDSSPMIGSIMRAMCRRYSVGLE